MMEILIFLTGLTIGLLVGIFAGALLQAKDERWYRQ